MPPFYNPRMDEELDFERSRTRKRTTSLIINRDPAITSSYTWSSPVPNDTPRTMSRPPMPSRQTSVTSSRNSTRQELVLDKFAELRDAAFYSSAQPGFLLSADEKLCYPHVFVGKAPEEPVELEDVESFFVDTWGCYDETFTRKLKAEEYPAVHLSRTRQPFTCRRLGLVKDNRRVVMECRGTPLYALRTGEFLGGITFVDELGDFEQVQQKKFEDEFKSFEAICDSLPHIVWSSDAQGRIDYWSKAWYDFSGLSEEESMGHGWRSAVHPDDVSEILGTYTHAMNVRTETDTQYRCRRKDGEYRWVHARASPRRNKEGEVIRWYGTTTDVHDAIMTKQEARKLERENARLLALENTARENSRMKSQFLAHMSHELRTPIAGIIGMVSLLRDTRMTVEQVDYADCIKTSAQNLLTIVNDVLDFSKIESGKLQIEEIPFDLVSLIDDLRRVWTLMANQKAVHFSVDTNITGQLEVLGDPTRIGQILSNLCSNSLKFTSQGSIQFQAYIEDGPTGSPILRMVVKDSGVGMDEKTLASLFTPFRQGDSSTARLYGGTGLGLTISRNLAHLMGGDLALESSAGIGTRAILTIPLKRTTQSPVRQRHGSTFHSPTVPGQGRSSTSNPVTPVTNPVTPTKPASSRRPSARRVQTSVETTPRRSMNTLTSHSESLELPPQSPLTAIPASPTSRGMLPHEERKDIRVLIAEDNAINQRIAVKTVQKLGFTAVAVDNGKEALDWLVANPVDIILMDCQMPLLDGYEATRKIRTEDQFKNIELGTGMHHMPGTWTPSITSHSHSRSLTNGGSTIHMKPIGRTLTDIPIIALTASAIPGDQAKCYEAGMSDYITKPLDARLLEVKLIKWVVGGGQKGHDHLAGDLEMRDARD